ncbi:MAG: hypothetical protein ACRC14_00285 [Paracoccaceae bacterium]
MGGTTMSQQGIHPELERRLAELEKPEMQGAGFGATDWVWLMALGVVGPAILLLWGWS